MEIKKKLIDKKKTSDLTEFRHNTLCPQVKTQVYKYYKVSWDFIQSQKKEIPWIL